jgi:hypothetical protein
MESILRDLTGLQIQDNPSNTTKTFQRRAKASERRFGTTQIQWHSSQYLLFDRRARPRRSFQRMKLYSSRRLSWARLLAPMLHHLEPMDGSAQTSAAPAEAASCRSQDPWQTESPCKIG